MIVLVLFIFIQPLFCDLRGTVYITDNPYEADFIVYEELSETFADLVVFEESNRLFADESGKWYFVQDKGLQDFSIYFTDEKEDADFSVFFTQFESYAGCQ